jgi:hypothetical protein
MKAYYARCIAIDQTPQYNRDIKLIQSLGWELVPDLTQEQKQEGYAREGMEFFLRFIREEAEILVFRSMPSLKIGAGVFAEIQEAQKKGIPIIELPSMILSREMTIAQTREYLCEVGKR